MKNVAFLLVFLSVIECSKIKFIDGYTSMNFIYNLAVPWVSSISRNPYRYKTFILGFLPFKDYPNCDDVTTQSY